MSTWLENGNGDFSASLAKWGQKLYRSETEPEPHWTRLITQHNLAILFEKTGKILTSASSVIVVGHLIDALNVKKRSKLLVSVSKLVDFIPAAIVSLSKLSFTVSKLSFSFKGYTFLGTPVSVCAEFLFHRYLKKYWTEFHETLYIQWSGGNLDLKRFWCMLLN